MPQDAALLIAALNLKPHPEGGFYAETFRADLPVTSTVHSGPRAASTAIYFLLRSDDFSAFHRVRSDEVWHHYAGDPLELFLLDAQGREQRLVLGSDLTNGQRPQALAPRDVLQAARVARASTAAQSANAHGYTLCGCTVAPGFDFGDFELPTRASLLAQFPGQRALIEALTR